MGRLVNELHHDRDCCTKTSEEKETPREEFNFSMKKTIQGEVQDTRTDGVHLVQRSSPRLQNIPKEKQPFYGISTRRHISSSKSKFYYRKTNCVDSKERFQYAEDDLPSNNATVASDARKTLKHVSNMRSEDHLFLRRVSPRLKDMPVDKRPYYGSVQRRKLNASKANDCDGKIQDKNLRSLNSFKDDNVGETTKDGTTMTKTDGQLVQKLKSYGNHLKQQISPIRDYLNLEGRTRYGSDQKRKLDTAISDLCWGKDFPGVENRGTENHLALGSASMKHEITTIVELEDEAFVAFTGRKYFLADTVHSRSVASVREALVGPTEMSICKDSNNNSCNSNKNEAENEMLDATLRKNALQNSQKIGLSELPLERRVSPRLKNIPVSKRPFYGSNQKGKLNAANDNISNDNDRNRQSSFPEERALINYDKCNKNGQNRQLSFPKDKISIQKSSVDRIIKKLLPNDAQKDIGHRDTIKMLDAGSGLVKYDKRDIVDLENYVSLKSLSSKNFSVSAHQMCEKVGLKMKGTVRTLDKHHPSVVQERASKDFSELLGLVCKDISYGKESMPIPATNLVDPPTAPSTSGFKYISTVKTGKDVVIPPSPPGCNCRGKCTNPKYCSCARLNGSDFPYVKDDGGRLIEPKDVVFECGPRCGCGPNCVNRTSQRGLKYQLEVYRTMNKGWAVRSWDFIPSGAFVCEYIGVIRKSSELDNDNVSENDFIFQIDCWHTMKGIGGRERRQGDVSIHARSLVDKVDEAESETEFCMDGFEFGNVTRFINHSCDPNLFVQCVLSSHRDIRLARIVLFAADDIPPMQELTYDYGCELDSVIGSDGKIKQLPCYCGTSECRGRLY